MRLTSLAMAAVIGLTLLSTSACGADTGKAAAGPDEATVKAAVAERLGIKVEDIQPSPVPGLFQVVSGTEVGYVSEDGRFYVDGDIFDMETRVNLTDRSRRAGRLAVLAGVREEDAIVFGPQDVKYTVTVFTAVDCGYCRRLHSEMAELNRLGVKVRYLMYPLGGPGTNSWQQAQAVWCSADRKDALTRAKLGEKITAKPCADPVAAQYELGREAGVNATPAIVTEGGDLIAGYMPAQRLVERLKMLAAQG